MNICIYVCGSHICGSHIYVCSGVCIPNVYTQTSHIYSQQSPRDAHKSPIHTQKSMSSQFTNTYSCCNTLQHSESDCRVCIGLLFESVSVMTYSSDTYSRVCHHRYLLKQEPNTYSAIWFRVLQCVAAREEYVITHCNTLKQSMYTYSNKSPIHTVLQSVAVCCSKSMSSQITNTYAWHAYVPWARISDNICVISDNICKCAYKKMCMWSQITNMLSTPNICNLRSHTHVKNHTITYYKYWIKIRMLNKNTYIHVGTLYILSRIRA